MHRLLTLLCLLAVGVASVFTPPPAWAQSTPPGGLFQVVHGACAYGTWLASGASCITGRVYNRDGVIQIGTSVTLSYTDATGQLRQRVERTQPYPTDQADVGEASFRFVLPPDIAPGTTVITLSARVDGQTLTEAVLLRPDPITQSQRIDLRFVDRPRPTLEGRVFRPGSTEALPAQVSLIYPTASGVLSHTVATTPDSLTAAEGFRFEPDALGISAGTAVTLLAEATVMGTTPAGESAQQILRQSVSLVWPGVTRGVDIYPGWNCDYPIPGEGPKGLPERFCLAGTVRFNGERIDDAHPATVTIAAGGLSIVRTTQTITGSGGLNFAANIGDLLDPADGDQQVIVSASRGTSSVVLLLSEAELRAIAERTLVVELDLRPEWSLRNGLPADVRVLAQDHQEAWAAALIDGGGAWLSHNGIWASTGPYQPCRSGTAVRLDTSSGRLRLLCLDDTGRSFAASDPCPTGTALDIIETRSGQGLLTCTGAATPLGADDLALLWTPTTEPLTPAPPAVDPPALLDAETIYDILASDQGIFAAAREGVLAGRSVDAPFEPLLVPPRSDGGPERRNGAKALALCPATSPQWLIALGADGLWRRTLAPGAEGWESLDPGVGPLNGRQLLSVSGRLLLGRSASANQLLASDNCGGSWAPISFADNVPMRAGVSSLVEADAAVFISTYGAGVWRLGQGEVIATPFNGAVTRQRPDGRAVWEVAAGGLSSPRVTALAVTGDGGGCQLYATLLGGGPAMAASACEDPGGNWVAVPAPPTPLVTDLTVVRRGDTNTLIAASAAGLYRRTGDGGWQRIGQSAGPLQLLSVVPASSGKTHLLLTGGQATSLLIYNESAPDVRLTIAADPPEIRPGETVTLTLNLTNIGSVSGSIGQATVGLGAGLSTTDTLTVTFREPLTRAPLNALAPGQSVSALLRATLAADMRPDPVVTVPVSATISVPDDSYTPNNSSEARIWARPPKGPRPQVDLVALGALSPTPAGRRAQVKVNLLYGNSGEYSARKQVAVVTPPPGVSINGIAGPYRLELGELAGSEQRRGIQCQATRCAQQLTITVPGPLIAGDTVLLEAQIGERDAPAADTFTLRLTAGAPEPETLLVIDGVTLGAGAAFYTRLIELQDAEGLRGAILRLDAELAAERAAILAAGSTAERVEATERYGNKLRKLIFAYRQRHPSITSVVLIGDDNVIPHGLVRRAISSAGDRLDEADFAADARFQRSMPVYATLAQHYYPSDLVYGMPHTQDPALKPQLPVLSVGRLVGTPAQILVYLEKAVANPTVNVSNDWVIGHAPEVSKDFYDDACEALGGLRCRETLGGERPKASLAFLGGHGSVGQVGPLRDRDLAQGVLAEVNSLAMTVSCHTGLSIPGWGSIPAAIVAGGSGQDAGTPGLGSGAIFTSLAYAYGGVGGIDYTERLVLGGQEILGELPAGQISIGEFQLRMLERYLMKISRDQPSDLDWKVIYSQALYGLPTLDIQSPYTTSPPPAPVAIPPTALDARQSQAGPNRAATAKGVPQLQPLGRRLYGQTISLDLSYQIVHDAEVAPPDMTSGIPVYNSLEVSQALRRGQIGTRQPRWVRSFEPISHPDTGERLEPKGVVLLSAEREEFDNYDPYIMQPLALSEDAVTIYEPADPVSYWEASNLMTTRRDSQGLLHAQLWLGSYFRNGSERYEWLLRHPRLMVVYGPPDRPSHAIRSDVEVCVNNGTARVRLLEGGFRAAYLTTTRPKAWESLPMWREGSYWVWEGPADQEQSFFIQTVDIHGNVGRLLLNSRAYFHTRQAGCVVYPIP